MEQCPYWEGNNHSLVKKFTAFYSPRRFNIIFIRARHWYLLRARCIQSTPSHPKIHFHSILPSIPRSSEWFLPFHFFHLNCISLRSHACYMLLAFHPPWLNHSNNICWSVQVMKLLITRSSLPSRHFLPLRSKYYTLYPVLKHPHSVFFPSCDKNQKLLLI